MIKKIFGIVLSICIVLCSCSNANADLTAEKVIESDISFLKASYDLKKDDDISCLPAEDSICDWIIFGSSEAGIDFNKEKYIEKMISETEKLYENSESLTHKRATEWHRRIITAISLGADPKTFGKKPDGNDIDLLNDGVFNFIGGDLGKQGVNGYVYALMSLSSQDIKIPEDSSITYDSLIETIISMQEPDGGFSIMKGYPDFDLTCMVLTSLSPYLDMENVKNAVESGVKFISGKIEDNGYVMYEGNDSSESISQLIITLLSLGIDYENDERFIKKGMTPVDVLLTYRTKDGGFKHNSDEDKGNIVASEQALLAFAALKKNENGKRLYELD